MAVITSSTEDATPDSWHATRTWLLRLLSVQLALVVVTGVALYFWYQPSASQAWSGLTSEPEPSFGLQLSNGLRFVHSLSSGFVLLTALATVIGFLFGAPRRTRPGLVATLVVFVIAPVAAYTGTLLPWDQLALFAVAVGTEIDGFGILLQDEVRFVLVDGVEIEPATVVRWLAIHAVLGLIAVGATASAWRNLRRSST